MLGMERMVASGESGKYPCQTYRGRPGEIIGRCGPNVCWDGTDSRRMQAYLSPADVPAGVKKIWVGSVSRRTLIAWCGPPNPQHWLYDHFWYHFSFMQNNNDADVLYDLQSKSCMEWSRDITLATMQYLNWSVTLKTRAPKDVYCTEGELVWLHEHRINHNKMHWLLSEQDEEINSTQTPQLELISTAVLQSFGYPSRHEMVGQPCHALIYSRLDCCRRQMYGAGTIKAALMPNCPSVTIVDFMPTSLKGQVDLFRNTTILIGWAGSYVVNYLWMPPDAIVIGYDIGTAYRFGPIDFGGWGFISKWFVDCFPNATPTSWIECTDANPRMVDVRTHKWPSYHKNFSVVADEPLAQHIMDAVQGRREPMIWSYHHGKHAAKLHHVEIREGGACLAWPRISS